MVYLSLVMGCPVVCWVCGVMVVVGVCAIYTHTHAGMLTCLGGGGGVSECVWVTAATAGLGGCLPLATKSVGDDMTSVVEPRIELQFVNIAL